MKNSKPPFHPHPKDSLSDEATQWNLSEWQEHLQSIDPIRLSELIPAASLHADPSHWREKLHRLVKQIGKHDGLEETGKHLSLEQLHEILYRISLNEEPISIEKLPLIFIGVQQPLFYGLITRSSPEQLEVLKRAAQSESVQHRLSLVSQQTKDKFDLLCDNIVNHSNYLESLETETKGLNDFKNIYKSIESFQTEANEILHVVEAALAIAWNTNRIDIIQEFNKTKDLCRRCISDHIGHPAEEEKPATGLWAAADAKFNRVFSEMGSEGFVTEMRDTDPAIEALVMFSIWHLKDYQEIGLIPNAPFQEDDPKAREKLFKQAEEKLASMGLHTLADLKRERIFSKQALLDFIYAIPSSETQRPRSDS